MSSIIFSTNSPRILLDNKERESAFVMQMTAGIFISFVLSIFHIKGCFLMETQLLGAIY